MVMQSLRNGATDGFLKYILLGILGMAAGGLVMTDVSGVFSGGGVGNNDVIKVGDETIDIRSFDNNLRQSIARYNLTLEQAKEVGVIKEMVTGGVREALLKIESKDLGIQIGKDVASRRIGEIIKPQAGPNESLQTALERLLKSKNIKEKTFVKNIKSELAVEVLTDTIRNTFIPDNTSLANVAYEFQFQTRDIDMILFADKDIDSIPTPKEEELRVLYESLKKTNYQIPEYRSADVIYLDPETLKIDVSITEQEIKDTYEENKNYFALGEQLVLTQVLAQTEDQANAIYALTQKGETLKNSYDKIMNGTGSYSENVPFETDQMLPQLAEVTASKEIGKAFPPTKTSLGFHVIKIVDILPPSTQPLNAVRLSIKSELEEEKRNEAYYQISSQMDDLLSRGVSTQEILDTVPELQSASIESIDATATNQSGEKVIIENFDETDTRSIANAVFAEREENTILPQELPSGRIAGFIVTNKENKTYKPFESVKDDLIEKFNKDQKNAENELRLQKHLVELETNGSTFKSIAKEHNKEIKTISKITIMDTPELPLKRIGLAQIFKMKLGSYGILKLEEQSALVKITGHSFPDMTQKTQEMTDKITAMIDQIDKENSDEAYLMYLRQLNNKHRPQVNQTLIERVYGTQNQSDI